MAKQISIYRIQKAVKAVYHVSDNSEARDIALAIVYNSKAA